MTATPKKVFFDTCVYLDAAKQSGGISGGDWDSVQRYVGEHYQTYVSWTTLKELLCRLANCRDEYFVHNQNALKCASKHGYLPGMFLEKPHVFAIRQVLGIDVYPGLDREGRANVPHQVWAESVLDMVFKATNKLELLNGVRLGSNTTMHGTFDLRDFADHEEQARLEFVRLSEGWRAGTVDTPNPIKIAANLLNDSGITPYTESSKKLSDALDAVNSTIDWLWKTSKTSSYSFEKHKNDWDDIQQLYYLCDPARTFVTLNTCDFMKWAKNSPQSTQIISWADFLGQSRRNVFAATARR